MVGASQAEQLALIKPGVVVDGKDDVRLLMLKDYRKETLVTDRIVRKYILAGEMEASPHTRVRGWVWLTLTEKGRDRFQGRPQRRLL